MKVKATTKKTKIKVISKNVKKPPVDMSFEEWLLMGKKMGWDKQTKSLPMIINTYEQDNDQIERHTNFLRAMTKIHQNTDQIINQMEEINREFKTEDKEEIFDPQILAQINILKGVIEYYKTGAIEQRKQLQEEQSYLLFQRYMNDMNFKKHIDEHIAKVKQTTGDKPNGIQENYHNKTPKGQDA